MDSNHILAWVLINSVFSGGKDWPMFQHDPHYTGYSLSNMPGSLKIAWVSEPVGDLLIHSLAVSENIVFVSGYGSLFTLDINTEPPLSHMILCFYLQVRYYTV
ncbi:MAG: hypothetical protein PVF58_06435 [Candidatus Methanofastidiosia archaeon]